MFDKLEALVDKYNELSERLMQPDTVNNPKVYRDTMKEYSSLTPLVEKYKEYVSAKNALAEAEELMQGETDKEFREMIEEQYLQAKSDIATLSEELKIMLLPKDPNDDKNVVMEIRAGTGGEEASLFGTNLLRMYMRYAERNRWKIEEIDMNYTDLGGVKEVVFLISGKGAYSKLKYESGAHRVQRVPVTESQGRIHTSAATVAVLPEVEDVDVEINANDLKIDTYRAGGAGGQYVNKTESAIRITHLPTGLVVTCQDEKSQIKNREKAMKVLKSKLYDYYRSKADKEYADARKSQVGSGDRSERIRTYNFPQGRVTDHRINMTLYSLDAFMDGDMGQMIEALQLASQNALLSESDE